MGFLLEDFEIPLIQYGGDALRLEPCPKRVRAFAAGEQVVDSRRVVMVLETGHLPVYYFPKEDVRMDLLTPAPSDRPPGRKGPGTLWSLKGEAGEVEGAFFSYEEAPEGCPDLGGLIGMYWARMDRIYEEDEEVFGHARDPRHRIEVLRTSRHIRVADGDVTLAESTRPLMLLETNLPPRYYIPKLDVSFKKLRLSQTTSMCPYKGFATQYWSTPDGRDVAWCYPAASLECALISNHVAFFSERVDLYVDGVAQERERTPWSELPFRS
jgi:uncharacterized protein (DUF427 family)